MMTDFSLRWSKTTGLTLAVLGLLAPGLYFGSRELRAADAASVAQAQYGKILSTYATTHDPSVLFKELSALTRKYPSFVKPDFNLALLAAGKRHWSEAVVLMTKYGDGGGTAQQEKAKKFIDQFRTGQSLDYLAAIQAAGKSLKDNKRDLAMKQLAEAQKTNPGGWEAAAMLAALSFEGKNYDQAIEFFTTARKNAPSDHQAGVTTGMSIAAAAKANLLLSQNKYADAAREFEKAWRLQPSDSILGLATATSYGLAHDKPAARRILDALDQSRDPTVQQQVKELHATL